MFLTFQNNAGGTVGIAYLGTVCHPGKQWRISINEYFFSDIQTARVGFRFHLLERFKHPNFYQTR